MTSTLSKLLKDTNEKRSELLKKRDYESAASLREDSFQRAAQIKVELEASRQKEQAIERRRLEMARDLAIKKAEEDVEVKMLEIEKHWEEKGRQLAEKQKEREAIALVTEQRREAQKPVVLSSYVRDLQRSEKRLADFHLYEDSAAVRRRIQKREVEERESALKDKDRKVEKVMARKKEKYEEELRSFRAKMRNEIALAKFQANKERERIHSMYDHLQRDISHDQQRESQINPLVTVYAKPRFAKGGGSSHERPSTSNGGILPIRPGAPRHDGAASAAGQTNATKGTTYFRKMQGSRFELPSLCDIYGHTLVPTDDESVNGYSTTSGVQNNSVSRTARGDFARSAPIGILVGSGSQRQQDSKKKEIIPNLQKVKGKFLMSSHGGAPLTADGLLDGSSYVS